MRIAPRSRWTRRPGSVIETRRSISSTWAPVRGVSAGAGRFSAAASHGGPSSARADGASAAIIAIASATPRPRGFIATLRPGRRGVGLACRELETVAHVNGLEIAAQRRIVLAREPGAAELEVAPVDQQPAAVGDPHPHRVAAEVTDRVVRGSLRSEEHTSEPQ